MEEFDLLEDRVVRLIKRLKDRSVVSDSSETEGLKLENRELKGKVKLLKTKIHKMIKEIDKIEEGVV